MYYAVLITGGTYRSLVTLLWQDRHFLPQKVYFANVLFLRRNILPEVQENVHIQRKIFSISLMKKLTPTITDPHDDESVLMLQVEGFHRISNTHMY